MGERLGLWQETEQSVKHKYSRSSMLKSRRYDDDPVLDRKILETERLISLGRPSQVLQRLLSLGLAHNTPEIRGKLLAKFPPCPPDSLSQVVDISLSDPITTDNLIRQIRSFAVGIGPGPDGLRADFLKALPGSGSDEIGAAFLQFRSVVG